MTTKKFMEQLKRGNATIIGVGQGNQSPHAAFPKQMQIAREVRRLSPRYRVRRTVDPDGERGVIITPALDPFTAKNISAFFRQRSFIQGKTEVETKGTHPRELTQFEVESVTPSRPAGFWTQIPEEGLYYKLAVVPSHIRQGRPVVGYATRKRRVR